MGPERYTDCYRERLRKVIDRKRKGQTIAAPAAEKEPGPVPDPMAALQRTLENVRAGEDPRARGEEEDDGAGDDAREELAALSRDELYERAQQEGVRGRTKMSKKELVEALAGE